MNTLETILLSKPVENFAVFLICMALLYVSLVITKRLFIAICKVTGILALFVLITAKKKEKRH